MYSAPQNGHRRKEILRGVLAVSIIIVGITHFLRPEQYARIVPPPFPPLASVYISGFFEILGGIGLSIPFVSVAAAWGLIALFIAVFPANIYMTLHNIEVEGIPHSLVALLGKAALAGSVDCLGILVHSPTRGTTRSIGSRGKGRAFDSSVNVAVYTDPFRFSRACRTLIAGAVQPTMPPWARIISRVDCLNSRK